MSKTSLSAKLKIAAGIAGAVALIGVSCLFVFKEPTDDVSSNTNSTTISNENTDKPADNTDMITTSAPETATSSETTVLQTDVSTPSIHTTLPETTPQTTTTATTTINTTTAQTTLPEPQWTENKVNLTKYVNTSCYSRKKAIPGAETVKLYNLNDKVTVVAKTSTGYYKLDDGSFIHSDYLNDSKVAITTTTTVQATTPPQTPPKPTTSTTVQTPPPAQTPQTREEELSYYYYYGYNMLSDELDAFTSSNINDYDAFLTVWHRFYINTVFTVKDGRIVRLRYTVPFDVNTSIYSYSNITESDLEKLIFLTLLNYDYINDETLKQLLEPYTIEELKGLSSNMIFILSVDFDKKTYYDYSKIVIDKNLSSLLENVQKSLKNKDYATLENLIYNNLGKYNDMVDAILIIYGAYSPTFEHDQFSIQLAEDAIDTMGVYDRVHS